MFINSEKDLEDYICDNIEGFISFIKRELSLDNYDSIDFIGRQVEIAGNRIDLLFKAIWDAKDNNFKEYTFIVVELKYRYAEPKDIAQLSRYMNLIRDVKDKLIEECEVDEIDVKGILLTFGSNSDVQEIQMNLEYQGIEDICFATYNTAIYYNTESFSRKEEYIENMTYDKRFITKEE